MSNKPQPAPNAGSMFVQLMVNFVLPIVVLTKFSSESALGPTKALLVALAFPVIYELYSIRKHRKVSVLSAVSIVGILVTGAISLLGLSEGWLAVRRSAPNVAVGLAIIISILIKKPLLNLILAQVLDMPRINEALAERHKTAELRRLMNRTGYMLAALMIIIAVVTYISTRIVIVSPTDTAGFNAEYARLRVISVPLTTIPTLVGMGAILMYLLLKIEKLTGIDLESLLQKRQ